MKRFASVTLVLLMLLTAAGPAAAGGLRAQKNLDPTLSCDVQMGLGGYIQQGGMLPILFEFENAGEARVVSVLAGQRVQATATFSVPPGSGIQRFLYVPVPYNYSYSLREMWFTDAESGRELAKLTTYSSGSSLQYVGQHSMFGPYTPTRSRSGGGTPVPGISLSGRKTFAVNEDLDSRYKLTVQKVSESRLPDNWVGYTSLNVVIVDYDVWQSPTLRREPLMHWMAMGGVCLMVDAPSGAKSGFREEVAKSAPFVGEWQDGGRVLPVGMGGAMFVDSGSLTVTHRRFFPAELQPVGTTTRNAYGSSSGPEVEGVGTLPFWPVLMLLTVFAALVGPVGWWYLVGKKQMGLLYYVAAPSLSLGVVVLVIAADIFHEGVTPRVSCNAVRLLDQRVKKAVDLSQFGVYAPFSLSGNLTGDQDEVAHFLSLGGGSRSYPVPQRGFSVRRAGDRRIYGGVLPAREKAWFGREWIGLERQRLVVWEEDGKIAVENHLDCTLADLLVNFDGKYAKFDTVAPGQKLAVEPGNRTSGVQDISGRGVTGKAERLVARLRRGESQGNYYVAESEDCVDRHVWLDSFRPSGTRVLIIGRF